MRNRLLTGLILAAALLVAGCKGGDAGQEESVSVSGLDDIIRLAPDPEDPLQFEIASNVGWSIVKKDLDWLTITPLRRLSSSGNSVVTLTAMPNTSPDARRGTFELTAGEKFSRKVTVEQSGTGEAPSFILTGIEDDAIHFNYEDQPRRLTLSCNRDWHASAEDLDWCTVSPMEGRAGCLATITVVPGKNEDTGREGRLSFDFGGEKPHTIVIGQAAFDAIISVSVTTVRASDTGRLEPATIDVTANGSWTASSSASWLTLDKLSGTGDDTVTPSVEVYEESTARSATLTFDNHGVKATVTVTQSGKITQYVTVSPKTVELTGKGTGVTVTVSANTAWKVTATESWITVSPATGTGDGVITISASANKTSEVRHATVTVASTEVDLVADDIEVSQEVNSNLDNFVDLVDEKMVWPCNDQDAAKLLNPDFANSGENGAVTGKGTGVLLPPTYTEFAYAKYVKGNTANYATTFIISVEGHYAFKKLWTDDAIEFHVPVVKIAKGNTLHFDFSIQATKATARYYRAEASFDGGKTYVLFTTGKSYPDHGNSNATITTAATPFPYRATLTAPSTLELGELIVRIAVADPTVAVNNSAVSSPNTGTLRLTDSPNQPYFEGPTIYVTE